MKIYAVRHGYTQMNKDGITNGQIDHDELIEEGFRQAEVARTKIPESVRHFYVSPLKRTRQTAEILNSERQLPMTFHDELMEVHFGEFQGKPRSSDPELRRKYRAMQYDYRPSGEHADGVKDRLLRFFRSIRNKHADHEAVIVTHGGIIRVLAMMNSNSVLEDIDNASIHEFDVEQILSNHPHSNGAVN